MTIIDGWCDWAFRVNGMRQDKRYPDENRAHGFVFHSQEGNSLTSMINLHQGDNPPSFMFWLTRTGQLHQFSPVSASVWCSGSYQANTRYWPVEAEGFAGEPLTDAQVSACLRLIDDWAALTGRRPSRATTARNIWEHREVATLWQPNAGATACPSERYAPLWAALEEQMALAEELARIKRLLVDTGVEQAGADGIDLLASLRNTQVAQQAHIDNHGEATTYTITGDVRLEEKP